MVLGPSGVDLLFSVVVLCDCVSTVSKNFVDSIFGKLFVNTCVNFIYFLNFIDGILSF